jgi:hypothetical protein
MDCREFADRLDEFFLGLMPSSLRRAAEDHRVACAGCRRLADIHGAELELAAAVPGIDLTPSILERTSGPACGAAEKRLGSLIDETLKGADAELVGLHLGHCEACRTLAAAMAMNSRELPLLAEIDPGPHFTRRVLAATAGRRTTGFVAALRDGARRLVLRPRFAFEAAYGVALVGWLLFGAPTAPWRVPREEALGLARANPVRAIVAASREAPDWLGRPVAAGRRALTDGGRPVLDRARASRAFWSGRVSRAEDHWPEVRDRGQALLDAAARGELSESALRLEEVGARLRTMWRTLFEPEPERAANPATQEA